LTVAIAVTVADGIVLAADSRTTGEVGGVHRVLSDATDKVFQVGKRAVATFGFAFLENRNIAAHMALYTVDRADPNRTVRELAEDLVSYFQPKVQATQAAGSPAGDEVLGFLVCGYDDAVGLVYEVALPNGRVSELCRTDTMPGAVWRGQTDVITRLVQGVDWELLAYVAVASGLDAEFTALRPALEQLSYNFEFDAINLQDAVDLALLAIRSTIDVQRLTFGTAAGTPTVPGVGGPIQVIVVRAGQADWLQRTALLGDR
jgi:hypothetical protein